MLSKGRLLGCSTAGSRWWEKATTPLVFFVWLKILVWEAMRAEAPVVCGVERLHGAALGECSHIYSGHQKYLATF